MELDVSDSAAPMTNRDPFALLPDELIMSVIVAINDIRAVAHLGQTCRRIYGIASDDATWREICTARHGTQPLPHQRFIECGRDWRWLYRAQVPSAHATGRWVGTITCTASGRTYMGDLYCGDPHGCGYATWAIAGPWGIKAYRGQWFLGEMHGRGIAQFLDGAVYDGDWTRGALHGHGACTLPNGEHYEGDWFNAMEHGHGVYTWPDGGRYEGDWIGGDRHGHGTHRYPNGDRYEGDWVHEMVHGKGTYAWPDGRRYEGDWVEDERHGHGIMRYADGRVRHGEWASDTLVQDDVRRQSAA